MQHVSRPSLPPVKRCFQVTTCKRLYRTRVRTPWTALYLETSLLGTAKVLLYHENSHLNSPFHQLFALVILQRLISSPRFPRMEGTRGSSGALASLAGLLRPVGVLEYGETRRVAHVGQVWGRAHLQMFRGSTTAAKKITTTVIDCVISRIVPR